MLSGHSIIKSKPYIFLGLARRQGVLPTGRQSNQHPHRGF